MDVPGRIQHQNVAILKYAEIKVPQIPVDPLGSRKVFHHFVGLVFDCEDVGIGEFVDLIYLVVHKLAVLHVSTGIQVGAVPERLICMGHYYLLEVDLVAGISSPLLVQ